ncbi:MAG: alkaline phosphatase [Ferruginibacter sp.]
MSHDSAYLLKTSTLENMYLVPLSKAIEKNGGYVYSDTNRILQLVIDLKTDATATLDALVKLLHKFPLIIHNPVVRIVITGNRPADSLFISYPAYIWFDGRLDRDYSKEALCRIAMLSADFKNYSRWEGNDTLPPFDKKVFSLLVKKAHLLKKPIRFWACPDGPGAWEELIRLNVDYINTDHIIALSRYLSQLN